ncbi:MAG: hypothetical protein QNJ97_19380 [Myxococcota bacterium]|nr:hypothetical protein [Myxococcota bacterium]
MNFSDQSPVFCDNCPTLALAELDDAPLCESCLLNALKGSEDPNILRKIAPLGAIPDVHRPAELVSPGFEAA